MEPLWKPSRDRIERANVTALARRLSTQHGADLTDYHRLWQWSVDELGAFWTARADFDQAVGDQP